MFLVLSPFIKGPTSVEGGEGPSQPRPFQEVSLRSALCCNRVLQNNQQLPGQPQLNDWLSSDCPNMIQLPQVELIHPMATCLNLWFPPQNRSLPSAGRLCFFTENWQKLTKDPSVLEIVSGIKIPFISCPIQDQIPVCSFSKNQTAVIDLEIVELLQKKAIVRVSLCPDQFLSSIFLVPKKDGGNRPVINLNVHGSTRASLAIPQSSHYLQIWLIMLIKILVLPPDNNFLYSLSTFMFACRSICHIVVLPLFWHTSVFTLFSIYMSNTMCTCETD